MFDRELTIGLSGVRRIIPTKLGISRPTLTSLDLMLHLPNRKSDTKWHLNQLTN